MDKKITAASEQADIGYLVLKELQTLTMKVTELTNLMQKVLEGKL